MIVDILRNVNLFVDGRGYAGRIDECIPPKLTVKTEDFRAGGMDGTVEIDQGLRRSRPRCRRPASTARCSSSGA